MSAGTNKLIKVYSYIIITLLAILVVRLAIIQIFKNDIYQTQAKENRIRLLTIKAPRGEIYAKDGTVLAANKLVYTLSLSALEAIEQEQVFEELEGIVKDYYPEVTAEYIQEKVNRQKSQVV
jgi:penicillin-binding protein 2